MTVDRLKELLHYDPETGVFTWRSSGRAAGTHGKHPYRRIRINGTGYYEHRLAWLYVHGVWPPDDIDHKDEDKTNNRIANLRLADAQNKQNQSKSCSNNKLGLLGVSLHKATGRYRAQIQAQGKERTLGYFNTPEEAHAAYLTAKGTVHPFWIPKCSQIL